MPEPKRKLRRYFGFQRLPDGVQSAGRELKTNMDGRTMNPGKPMGQMNQMSDSDDNKKPTKASRLDRGTRAKLGQQLRAMYDEVVSQGVPSRFSELLDGLDNKEGKQNAH
jgi:hypothetical protein